MQSLERLSVGDIQHPEYAGIFCAFARGEFLRIDIRSSDEYSFSRKALSSIRFLHEVGHRDDIPGRVARLGGVKALAEIETVVIVEVEQRHFFLLEFRILRNMRRARDLDGDGALVPRLLKRPGQHAMQKTHVRGFELPCRKEIEEAFRKPARYRDAGTSLEDPERIPDDPRDSGPRIREREIRIDLADDLLQVAMLGKRTDGRQYVGSREI